jgi:hypothetical protein
MILTHDERMALARKLNAELAASRAAGAIATRDLIRSDAITAEETAELVGLYPEWRAGTAYAVGDLAAYQGTLYQCLQAHTSQADWPPDITPALWLSKSPKGVILEWKQPTGGHDAYNTGDLVLFQGQVYESTIDGNVWSPVDYPAGWRLID